MKLIRLFFFILLVLTVFSTVTKSQSIRGFVYSVDNNPIPYVNVYVKHTDIGTTTDENGNFYLRLVEEGDYELVFSIIGYENKILPVIVETKELSRTVWLTPNVTQIEEIEITAKKRDPAYGIIKSAVDAKKDNSKMVMSYKCNVYIKAKEVITEKERKRREEREKKRAEQEKIEKEREDTEGFEEDPSILEEQELEELQKQKNERMALAYSMNMAEINLELNYLYPNNIKEIRNGYEKYGYTRDLFFLSTTEAEFNFYQNLLDVGSLNELPFVSPLNNASVLSYKFKLEETWFENDQMIYHIKVTPRKKGNATFEGYIDIIFGSYAIRRVDLSVEKGGLMFYDSFRIQQEYELFKDSIWLVTKQEFDYTTKEGRTSFTGKTTVKYDNFELDVKYPKKYFKNELAVTTQEAYERDTTYWEDVRPAPLTIEEQEIIFIQDSIKASHNTEEYLDSIDAAYNKVTFADIALWGPGFFNREKERHFWVNGLTSSADPFSIGGLRIGPHLMYFKKFKNHNTFNIYSHATYGIRNEDINGSAYIDFKYNPIKLSRFSLSFGRGFDIVQQDMSFAGLIDRSNYVADKYIRLGHSTEITNGFYINTSLSIKRHSSLADYKFGNITSNWVSDNIPREFDPYNLVVGKVSLSYVPFQKYMTEPYEKIVLGSKWPTFSASYTKGFPNLLNSEVNFDLIEASITQKIKVSTFGTSTVRVASGKFLNTKQMHYENYKIFPRGDNWFFSSPMQNQMMDSTIYTTDLFVELHGVHHFNGALVNNIPLIKKLRLYTLTGFNYTWISETNYHYLDYYVGVERTFRIKRQRFRLGVYFVYGGSNNSRARPTIQFSLNHYDKREKSWDY